VRELQKYAHKPPTTGLSEEHQETVKAQIRAYPNLDPKRMVFDLEHRHGIRITVQRLKTIRAAL
jgi:hypothetical protein